MTHEIDMETYPRREAYEFFARYSNPFYMLTFRQDVTRLYDFVKANGLSFYYSMIWACTKAMNNVEAFHHAIQNGKLVRLDERIPSFTDLKPGSEQFYIVTMDMLDDIREFSKEAARISHEQTSFLDTSRETDALIYFSCVPWLEMTGLTNEMDTLSPEHKYDSVPRISWGKYVTEENSKKLSIAMEVNHRLIDGYHLGQFGTELTRIITEL